MAVFLVGPMVVAVALAFTDFALTGPRARDVSFVGLANFTRLAGDPVVGTSIWLTVLFVVTSVAGQTLLGLAIAEFGSHVGDGLSRIVSMVVIAAWVIPEIVAAFIMYAAFSGGNQLFDHPMRTVILANIWRGTAFSMLMYQAALRDVPDDLVDAAAIDGADGWRRFRHVTLPVIGQTIATSVALATLQTCTVFTLIWVMTAGGPGHRSTTLPVLAYQAAFQTLEVGYGSAISCIVLVVAVALSWGVMRRTRRA